MKKNLFLVFTLVALGGSVSAMEEQMEKFMELTKGDREVSLSDRTKQLKNRLKKCFSESPSEECLWLATNTLNSWINDFKGMKECHSMVPLNFKALDEYRNSKNNTDRYARTITTLERKLELLDLCLRAQTNENKK